jgi:ABC-2 type transport system ATP-binding protein
MAQGRILAAGTSEDLKNAARTAELPAPTMEDAFVALIAANGAQQSGQAA